MSSREEERKVVEWVVKAETINYSPVGRRGRQANRSSNALSLFKLQT